GKVYMPGLDDPEAVFPLLALEVINPWIGIIIVTGILGAAMSTVDSNLLGASIHVSRDIYERYMKEENEEVKEKQAKIGRESCRYSEDSLEYVLRYNRVRGT